MNKQSITLKNIVYSQPSINGLICDLVTEKIDQVENINKFQYLLISVRRSAIFHSLFRAKDNILLHVTNNINGTKNIQELEILTSSLPATIVSKN